jgi:hypothetical protein
VASFGWESAYVLTFGGVVRYDISGTEPVPAGYQPANDDSLLPADQDFTTEHLKLVNFGTPGIPEWRLIAATAEGSFFEWPLDAVTHDPEEGEVKQPPPGYWPGGWTGGTYGNDIATLTHPTGKWVLIDYSNTAGVELALGRHNWTTGDWPISPMGVGALKWQDPTPELPNITPNIRDLNAEGDKWLLAAANGGFLVVNAVTWVVTDYVYTNAVDGRSFAIVGGIEKHGNRIFASLGDATNRFAVAMYAFNPSTGRVVDLLGQPTDAPIQVLFDGIPGKPDDFPGVFINEGEKMSLVQLPGSPKKVRLYSGTGNGHLLEIEWQESTDSMTPLSYWHNGGYFDHVADCNVYMMPTVPPGGSSFGPVVDFTLRIVVGKTRETFEIVSPPDMP